MTPTRLIQNALFQPTIAFCFFLAACLAAKAQEGKTILKIAPLSLADDPSFPTVQPGIEIRIGKRFSWFQELGIKYRKSAYEYADTDYLNSKGWKLKSEFRYYINNNESNSSALSGWYAAANIFCTRERHNARIHYFFGGDSALNYTDDFGVYKTVYGFNLLAGKQVGLGKRWVGEFYVGLGLRLRDVRAIGLDYNRSKDFYHGSIDLNINTARDMVDTKPGHSATGNLSMGIRLGYLLF